MTDNATLTMNMLKKAAAEIGPNKYQDIVVLHINHCMDNSFYFNDVLADVFGKTIFIGTPYNNKTLEGVEADYIYYIAQTGEDYYELYRNEEMIVRNDSSSARELSVGTLTRLIIKTAIERDVIPELEHGKRFLVIEDGGEHFEVVNELAEDYPILTKQMIGSVEQTTSGTRKYYEYSRASKAQFPCASVARSRAKMSIEAVFIGQRIIEELSYFMYTANSFLNYQNLVLLGYGIVGRSVRISAQPYACNIMAYDKDPELTETIVADKVKAIETFSPDVFDHDTVIVGNVGLPSFNDDMLLAFMQGNADKLYLASASSKSIEFLNFIIRTIEGAEDIGLELELVEKAAFYKKYAVRDIASGKTKHVFLFADGVPVNFYRKDAISLTFRLIDLIFTEMFLLGVVLIEKDLDNRLYMLGTHDPVDKYIDEPKLIRDWFDINKLYTEGELVRGLRIHPKVTHLRAKFLQ